MNEYTIIVPDTQVLSCVCGTNDNNLKLIEQYLGLPIFTRGNELSIDTEDSSLRQKFQYIIDCVVDEVNNGCTNCSDVIASVLNFEHHADMENTSILINGANRKIYPRSQNQADYIKSMREHDMTICYGSAGSGKTFLAVAEALQLVLSHKKSKIVLSRPVVEAGESLGFLPGDLNDKISPYLRPLYDAMQSILNQETVKKLVESDIIEIAPLAYMRGRTLNNSVIILDEAQNTTVEQMKMFLTRMGEGSKVFVTGDITQIDLPKRVESGLIHAINLLSSIAEIGINRLTTADVVRNPLVKKIVRAYENEEK